MSPCLHVLATFYNNREMLNPWGLFNLHTMRTILCKIEFTFNPNKSEFTFNRHKVKLTLTGLAKYHTIIKQSNYVKRRKRVGGGGRDLISFWNQASE